MPFVDIKMDKVTEENIKKFGLTEDNIENFVYKYDVIVPKRSFCVSNYYHYKTANGHHIKKQNK